MKLVGLIAVILSFLQVSHVQATERVEDLGDGWHRQKHEEPNVFYLVDTQTKLCFIKASGESVTSIPCASLKLREKWEDVIEEMYKK